MSNKLNEQPITKEEFKSLEKRILKQGKELTELKENLLKAFRLNDIEELKQAVRDATQPFWMDEELRREVQADANDQKIIAAISEYGKKTK